MIMYGQRTGEATGRVFYVVEGESDILTEAPYADCPDGHDAGEFCGDCIPYATWTEFKVNEELWYVSDDPDGYFLNAEEFGPIPGDES